MPLTCKFHTAEMKQLLDSIQSAIQYPISENDGDRHKIMQMKCLG